MSKVMEEIASWGLYIFRETDMGYTSFVFMGCLAVFFVVYFLVPQQSLKRICILFANLVFYVWAGSRDALIIVCATAVIVYLISRRMETIYSGYVEEAKNLEAKNKVSVLAGYKKKTKPYLWLALVLILGIWIFVKVCKLVDLKTVGSFRNFSLFETVIVPLGISYYTLSAVGYLLDVYWQKTKPEHNFLTLFSVMTYFPHIVEGPISKYQRLTEQMHHLPKFDYTRVCNGLQLMLWGYLKKMVIADRLSVYTTVVFAKPDEFAGVEILLAVILCTIQLYADFSGCMDIVLGISQVIGIEMDQNFRQPFFAKSAAEFWRRWHITLGNWTREYIYMPIATNSRYMRTMWQAKKKAGTYLGTLLNDMVPMFTVWLFTGLWHGSGWSYIVWGLYWFLLMILSEAAKPYFDRFITHFQIHTDRWYYRCFQMLRTFSLFAAGRMFTVAGGLAGCGILWRQLFSEARLWTLFDGSLYTHGLDQKDFYVVIIGIIILIVVDVLHERGIHIREKIAEMPLVLRWIIYLSAIFAILILGVYGSGYDAASFMYGDF